MPRFAPWNQHHRTTANSLSAYSRVLQRKSLHRNCAIEALESRQLLSASIGTVSLMLGGTSTAAAGLTDGLIVDVSKYSTSQIFGIRAATNPNPVGSVTFNVDGSKVTENARSYDAFGTGANDVAQGKALALGQHTVTITPYDGANASGTVGTAKTIRFTLQRPTTPVPVPPPTTSLPTPTLWVSPTGSDSNSGSQNSPLRSVGRAVSVAGPGSVVFFQPGTYSAGVSLTRSGTATAPITFEANPGTVVFDAAGKDFIFVAGWQGPRYITVRGIAFANAVDAGSSNDRAAVRLDNNWTLIDCVIRNNGGGGLSVSSGQGHASNVTLTRVQSYANGRFGIGGSWSQNLLIEDSVIRDNNWLKDSNGGGGKFTRTESAVFDNVKIANNIGSGIYFDVYNLNVTIRNSEVYGNRSATRTGLPTVDGCGINFEISGSNAVEGGSLSGVGYGNILLENNNVHDNDVTGILCYASFNMTLQGNTLGNNRIELKDGGRDPYLLKNLTITGNRFNNATITADSAVSSNYRSRNFVIDRNTYHNNGGTLVRWSGQNFSSLSAIRSTLGFEANGSIV